MSCRACRPPAVLGVAAVIAALLLSGMGETADAGSAGPGEATVAAPGPPPSPVALAPTTVPTSTTSTTAATSPPSLTPTTAPPAPPAPTPRTTTTTAPPTPADPVEAAIRRWFGDVEARAREIAWSESRVDPGAVSPGGGNHGLFQINTVHRDAFLAVTDLPFDDGVDDPELNARFARHLYDGQGWEPWSCA